MERLKGNRKAGFMKTLARMLCVVLLAASGACHSAKQNGPRDASAGTDAIPPPPGWVVTGKVRHVDVEGGFYGIVTDRGTKLDPINLPGAFQQDGLRIRARVETIRNPVSSHMWGIVVNILEIERQ
jgi:hypothetical protein